MELAHDVVGVAAGRRRVAVLQQRDQRVAVDIVGRGDAAELEQRRQDLWQRNHEERHCLR
eukprot:SAG22_NODE_1996_length_3186_cov_23.257856_3_plen_60_part_00